jgi:hypothetical protein
MTKPIVKDVDAATGTEVEREMTDQEFTQYLKDKADYEAKIEAEQNKENAKAAVLAKLGLTADEVAALLS